MNKLSCLKVLDTELNIFERKGYIDNIILNLKKIDRKIHKNCIEDNAVKLSENILLKSNFKDKNIYSKSPLQLFKIDKKEEAFKLANLFFPEDRYLWYLLFIWYLKLNNRKDEVEEIINKMVEERIFYRDGWVDDAVNIIYKEIIDLNPEIFSKIYFAYISSLNSYSVHEFNDIFLKGGFYEQAIEAANYLVKKTLKDKELYKNLIDKYPNEEFTLENVNSKTEKILNEVFYELTNQVVNACINKNEIRRAEKLVSNISLCWARVDGLLKIADYYNSIGRFEKVEKTLKEASDLALYIEDMNMRKKYIFLITDKVSKEKVININSDEGNVKENELEKELDKFINSFNNYIFKRKNDKYMELISRFIKDKKIKEAEKVLDTLPYDYDNWDIVRLIQERYILLGDFQSAIAINEKYQYKISRLHGITFILDKAIKCGIDQEIALSILEKNILESYKPCTRWNKCEELFRISYIQGINGYKEEAKKSAYIGLKVLESINQGRGEFLKLAVRALGAAEEYNKALELIQNEENESMKNYAYIELVKIYVKNKEYIKANEIIYKIQGEEFKSLALAEESLIQLKMEDEINGLKNLNSCYRLIQENKINTNHYFKKILCEIEAVRGNLYKAMELIKEMTFMKDEAIESVIEYINTEEKLREFLMISNNIDMKFDGCSYVNSHLLLANSFRNLGNLDMYNKIKSDMHTLVQIQGENIWKDRISAYITKVELIAGDRERFLKLAKEFSQSFKGELYSVADVFKIIKDKAVFKQFVCSVDFTKKEAYNICEIIAFLYPEFSSEIAELIYEL